MRFEVAKIFLTIKHFRMCCFGQDASSALTASIFSTVIIEKNNKNSKNQMFFTAHPVIVMWFNQPRPSTSSRYIWKSSRSCFTHVICVIMDIPLFKSFGVFTSFAFQFCSFHVCTMALILKITSNVL